MKQRNLSMIREFFVSYRYWTLFLLFAVHVGLFWPGILVPDSMTQYHEAMAGVYSDHHPPLMAFLWRYLSIILPGPASMFLIQLGLFYGGMFFILKSIDILVDLRRKHWVLLLVFLPPVIPQLSLYSVLIQKDNHFAGSFFFIASYFAYLTVSKKRLSASSSLGILIILIYGVSVKFQAQFLAPLLLVWMGAMMNPTSHWWKKGLRSILLAGLCYGSVAGLNAFLVPPAQESNSWQFVKLFDLAAISLQVKKDLIPEANKTEFYSWEKLQQNYDPFFVNAYTHYANAILKKTQGDESQEILMSAWRKAVLEYPVSYLLHRARVFSNNIFFPIGFNQRHLLVEHLVSPSSPYYPLVDQGVQLLGFFFSAYWWIIALGFVYFGLAIYGWRRSDCAPILLAFSGFGVGMCCIMFFKTMAGTPRYLYPAVMMLHGAHIFAWKVWQDLRKTSHHRQLSS